ncbi:glucose dehydrogenase [FAD, quinone]-like [Bombyx mandarina]|uniref:Glucose dehydrogenase [FAD, quinone]-like n=1 Tax=Bombyx mandarina TaxID=7092 RepID=A0A6J2KP97_BOMMA|nr:glucose dehydrogenase [FAD, quinone]-like [Bombyx mandarina]
MKIHIALFTILFIRIFGDSDDDVTVSIDDEEYAVPMPCREFCDNGVREKRIANSPVKSKILDVMMKTPQLHLDPAEPDVLSFLRDKYELPKGFKGPLAEYDFIIVGAGSAGSVLAARLSEGRQASVLLLEAGLGESLITSVPILAPLLQQTEYVWPYKMEFQPGICVGMTDERCFWPRGKAVGGTSVVNYMIYTRGFAEDWNRIAADGNYGWSYKDVIPYYMKSERAYLKGLADSPWHGRDGELNVEYVPFKSKLSKAFLDAAKLFGHRRVDYNSPDAFGFSYIQATMSHGHRTSSAKAFLHDHKKRKNLHILNSSTVTKILIDPLSKTATGVEFHRNGRVYQINAKKEVILSAGPIESPHLLMLSGIGPKDHLNSFGIPVIQDLKVGESLYDHISYPGLAFTINTTKLTLVERKIATIDNVLQLEQYGDGPMSSLAGVETIGYIKTNISKEPGDYPDIELLGSCASLASDEGDVVAKGIHLADWLYQDIYRPIENVESFTVLFMLLHPKSKGHLKLRSTNPFDHPKLYGNYMIHPDDTATMVEAIKYIIKLVDTSPFHKYGAKLYTKPLSTCKHYQFGSDKYWECAVRTITSTLHHQIATCKMGPSSDPEAVVDPELKVHGVNNLRVVDSSIIPKPISAHTNAPAIMIGEKAAALIKKSWKLL